MICTRTELVLRLIGARGLGFLVGFFAGFFAGFFSGFFAGLVLGGIVV
jgi:hypothetical protein